MTNALTAFMYLLVRDGYLTLEQLNEVIDIYKFRERGIKGYRLSDEDLGNKVEAIIQILKD